jgi:hypothetical protein
MVTINVNDRGQIYLNKYLLQEIDTALYAVKHKNQDLVLVFDGPEGGGKSTAARQLAFYCAKKLGSNFQTDTVYNIHNDIDKYIRSSSEGAKYDVHILDEARKILNRKRSTSKDAVRFTNYLSECRFMNQVHIICIPAFHDLDRYVAQWRLSFVIHMYKEWSINESIELGGHELHLGAFKLYMNDSFLKYAYDSPGFQYPKLPLTKDRFNKFEILTDEGSAAYEKQKYDQMKFKYLLDGKPEKETPKDMALRLRNIALLYNIKLPTKAYAEFTGKSERSVQSWFRTYDLGVGIKTKPST